MWITAEIYQKSSTSTSRNDLKICWKTSLGMERKGASVISAGFIMLLTFTGLVEGTVMDKCRTQPCDKESFDIGVYEYCVFIFNQSMAKIDYHLKCPWPTTRRNYIDLMMCMEQLGNLTCCAHASFRRKVLLEIHQLYFSLCLYMTDPDLYILLLLIFPCIIITLMIPLLFQKFRLHEKKLPKDDY